MAETVNWYYTESIKEIGEIQRENQFSLPQDFIALYARVNGMQTYYPNEIDNEGFLFYPVEAIASSQKEFETSQSSLTEKKDLYIFAEYMHKSWWYAVDINYEHNSYEIGIIPDGIIFKKITNSLSEFIDLYLEDSAVLYDYSLVPSSERINRSIGFTNEYRFGKIPHDSNISNLNNHEKIHSPLSSLRCVYFYSFMQR